MFLTAEVSLTDTGAEDGAVHDDDVVLRDEGDCAGGEARDDERHVVDEDAVCPGSVRQPPRQHSTQRVEET